MSEQRDHFTSMIRYSPCAYWTKSGQSNIFYLVLVTGLLRGQYLKNLAPFYNYPCSGALHKTLSRCCPETVHCSCYFGRQKSPCCPGHHQVMPVVIYNLAERIHRSGCAAGLMK